MPQHPTRPGLRAVESDTTASTPGDKPFEVALARALDALPYGAQRQFAIGFGRSDTWVGRMRDPFDPIHVPASRSVRACQLVGTMEPLQALLDDTRVGGELWHVVPRVGPGTIGDLTRASMSASAEIGRCHQGILGTARLAGVCEERNGGLVLIAGDWPEPLGLRVRPWFVGRYGWLLDDRRALPEPIPCRGMQGLWTVPDAVAAMVAAAEVKGG